MNAGQFFALLSLVSVVALVVLNSTPMPKRWVSMGNVIATTTLLIGLVSCVWIASGLKVLTS